MAVFVAIKLDLYGYAFGEAVAVFRGNICGYSRSSGRFADGTLSADADWATFSLADVSLQGDPKNSFFFQTNGISEFIRLFSRFHKIPLYGFAFCFILTSIFTLDTFRTLKWYLRPLPWTIFMIWVFIYYEFVASSGKGDWTDAIDACKIPAILYFTAFCGYFTMEMFHWATKKVRERLNPWIWMFLAFCMVALFTLLSILSYQLEWTKLIDFPKLGNKLWTPTNGVLTGMFLVFLDNHFFAVRKQRWMESSVEEQEIKEETVNQ